MRDETVSKSYGEALFELALRHDALDAFEGGVEAVAALLEGSAELRLFLETPRIDDDVKKRVLRAAFEDELPRPLVNFLLVTVDKRRQRLLRDIARQFRALVDRHRGRTHVEVTLAREPDPGTLDAIGRRLSDILDTEAIPHVRVKPRILGGVVIRAGDTVYDGSIQRRLEGMRRRLHQVALPETGGTDLAS